MKYTLMTTSMVFPLAGQLEAGVPVDDVVKQYDEMLKMVSGCGLGAVEITSLETDVFGLDHVKKALADAGLECGCFIHMDAFAETDPARHEAIVETAKQKIQAAEELGSKYVMLALMAQPDAEKHSEDELRSALIRNIRPIAEFGWERGVTVSVEDTPEIRLPLSSSDDMKAVLDSIPELSLTFDTGNMIHRGDEPLHFYDELKNRVAYVHVKDMAYTDDPACGDKTCDGRYITAAMHGEGIIDFDSIFSALKQDGYDGWLMLEYVGHENHAENISAAKKWLDEKLA